jgi:hypothetical protein
MGRFDRERQTYEREKQRLLQYEGEYVVIFGDDVLGHWMSRDQAYREGRQTYGRRPFMMARISLHEPYYFQPYVGIADAQPE